MNKISEKLDLIIIGGGPAGLAAAIYAARYQIKHLVIGGIEGGQLSYAHAIENYPGFTSIKGLDLLAKFKEHAEKMGSKIVAEGVKSIKKLPAGTFEILTSSEKTYQAKSLILAMGMERRRLNIPGEKELIGKGVSYCAVCDAAFFKDKTVVVIGGSNSAAMATQHLSEFAKQVYQIYRKDKLRSEPVWTERVLSNSQVKIIYNTNVTEIKGTNKVEQVILDRPFENQKELKVDGVFIEIGFTPQAALVESLDLELDQGQYVKINPDGATNVKGIYAAGDLTSGSNKLAQVVTAVSEGAIAATSVYRYLNL